MDVRAALANNLQALIDGGFANENNLAVRSGASKTTIRRMRLNEAAAQIDKVEEVATVFRLRACDLLDPDLARRIAAKEPLRMREPRPPVMEEVRWRALSPRTRAFVEEVCERALGGQVSDADIAWLHDGLSRASAAPKNAPEHAVETTDFAGAPTPREISHSRPPGVRD